MEPLRDFGRKLSGSRCRIQQNICQRLCQVQHTYHAGNNAFQNIFSDPQGREHTLCGGLDLLGRIITDDEFFGDAIQPLGKALDLLPCFRGKNLLKCLTDGLCNGSCRIHQIPQALHQMLSAGKFPDLFRVSLQVKRSILNFLVQLFKGLSILLNFFPIRASLFQFSIAQGQHFLST